MLETWVAIREDLIKGLASDPKILLSSLFRVKRLNRRRLPLAEITNPEQPLSKIRVVATAHVFYDDFAELLLNAPWHELPYEQLLVTTSSRRIQKLLSQGLSGAPVKVEIILCENRGRNFGPLFVEIGKAIEEFDYMVHIHSKRSPHHDRSLSREWSACSWDLFLNPTLVRKALAFLSSGNACFVACEPPDWLRMHTLHWGSSRNLAASILDVPPSTLGRGILEFPVGGMFACKASSLSALTAKAWTYGDFPEEKGQLRGTPQHAIERAVGTLCFQTSKGAPVYYSPVQGSFVS